MKFVHSFWPVDRLSGVLWHCAAHKNHQHIQQNHFHFSCFIFMFYLLFRCAQEMKKIHVVKLRWIEFSCCSPYLHLNYYLAHFVVSEFHLQLHAALNKVKIDSNARNVCVCVCAWIKGKSYNKSSSVNHKIRNRWSMHHTIWLYFILLMLTCCCDFSIFWNLFIFGLFIALCMVNAET